MNKIEKNELVWLIDRVLTNTTDLDSCPTGGFKCQVTLLTY